MRKSLRPIASLLLGIGFLLAGNGMLFTLLPLRGTAEHFSAFALGLIGSSYYVGFVAGCVLAPFVVQSSGHIRAFAALVALAVTASLVGVAGITITVSARAPAMPEKWWKGATTSS